MITVTVMLKPTATRQILRTQLLFDPNYFHLIK